MQLNVPRLIDIRQWLKEILVVPYLRSNIRALHYVWAQTGPGGFATISLNFEDLTVSIHSRYRGQGAAVLVNVLCVPLIIIHPTE